MEKTVFPATYEGATSVRHTRIVVTRYGGPDTLKVVEDECPEPKLAKCA
jgi:hypothetical protein